MKKILYITLSMVVITILILSIGLQYRKSQINKVENITWNLADQIISELDDEALIKQLFMFYFQLDDEKMLEQLMPGSIFIHTKNIPVLENGQANLPLLDSYIEKINNIYRKKNLPLPFYSIDQEGGRVRRIKTGSTDFPSAMAIAESYTRTKKKDLPLLVGFYTCMELRMHGIQWVLTPVVDVQINPDNPVIGMRSFGSDPELVSEMAIQYVKGAQNARCMTAIKHFPGHGDTNIDSHLDLPFINKTENELNQIELYPYQELIHSKNPPYGLMSAHIIFNQISAEPSTLSYTWLTEKLRNKWNYKGIIITDDLAMNAMNIYQRQEKINNLSVQAFLAGADVLLYAFKPNESINMLNGFIKAYKNEIISKQRIVESVRRIIYRKVSLGLMDLYIKEHKNNWSAKLQQESEIWLHHSNDVDLNIKNIETQLAKVDSINQFISKNGIKSVYGSPGLESNVQKYSLFTDVSVSDANYKLLQSKSKKIYSLKELSEVKCDEKCVILQTLNTSLEYYLKFKKTKPWIIYTVEDPFPAKKFIYFLNDSDILISPFSDTSTSRQQLIETWISNVIPPKASVIYQKH
ncbi:MAG: glycoside hydrolase family 3 protein [Spirochaetia bacterium]|nr:glycoside hydrolase family 3 protein [Spirochaetia bacterium]